MSRIIVIFFVWAVVIVQNISAQGKIPKILIYIYSKIHANKNSINRWNFHSREVYFRFIVSYFKKIVIYMRFFSGICK